MSDRLEGWTGGGVAAGTSKAGGASDLPPDELANELSKTSRIVAQLKTMRTPMMMPMMSLMGWGVFLLLERLMDDQCGAIRTVEGST